MVHYVRPGLIDDGIVDASAFAIPRDHGELSVNWLEYFRDLPKEHQLQAIRSVIQLKLRRNGRFAELSVGETERQITAEYSALSALCAYAPSPPKDQYGPDPSHCNLTVSPAGYSEEIAELLGEIVLDCVRGLHPALP